VGSIPVGSSYKQCLRDLLNRLVNYSAESKQQQINNFAVKKINLMMVSDILRGLTRIKPESKLEPVMEGELITMNNNFIFIT
jgi:hypothetical protein